jgi:DNA-binding HxlR family transcriptional regulator
LRKATDRSAVDLGAAVSRTVEPRICNIARSLEVVGERWSLLAMREITLGVTTFDQIVKNTGAPRNILTTRLNKLVEAGVLVRRRYSERPPRDEYQPTEAGWALAPVLLSLMAWGDRYVLPHEEPPTVFRHSCGQPVRPQVTCACCGEAADPASLTAVRIGGKPSDRLADNPAEDRLNRR